MFGGLTLRKAEVRILSGKHKGEIFEIQSGFAIGHPNADIPLDIENIFVFEEYREYAWKIVNVAQRFETFLSNGDVFQIDSVNAMFKCEMNPAAQTITCVPTTIDTEDHEENKRIKNSLGSRGFSPK